VQQIIKLREGEWTQDERGRWYHVRGGIKCPGTDTAHVYRWQPFQVFVLASVFGFHTWFNTEVKAIDKPELLVTEREREDGYVEDFRRLCNYFVLYTPRKTDKTGMSAYIQVVFFLMGDYNSEIYCCANAEFQSRILYGRTTFMLNDADTKQRFDMTSRSIKWKPKFHAVRNAMIMPLTAGGKTKDGPFAELVNWDELGSSPYTNGKSDMMNLVNVMRSSMGPRREGLTFGTTTAGTITSGPFIDMLQGLHDGLLMELKYDTGEAKPSLTADRQLCLLLEPDDWEKYDEQRLLTDKNIRRKINPMLGITCQHQFYEDSIADMYNGKMTRGELFSKLFNVYASNTEHEWIKPEQVRELQIDRRIDECTMERGWNVYAAFDFSHGDDFDAVSFLAYNANTNEYFADCDAWVNRQAFLKSPYHELYERWERDGWLHVSGDTVVAPEAPITRVMELDRKGINFIAFGYDAKQSKEPILLLKEWLFNEIGVTKPDTMVVPVSQVFSNYNAPVQKIDYCFGGVVNLTLSMSPLWPFEFGNCVLEEDLRMGNKKPLKRTANAKVDNVQCLCSCFNLEESFEQVINK
jgi:phage terminase large subunit-like protein